jgi:CubicO group peptidase (beta-lactamase class C family)
MPVSKDREVSDALAASLSRDVSEGVYSHFFVSLWDLDRHHSLLRLTNAEDDQAFDLGSITKALATTPLVFKSIEENKLSLDTRLGSIPACLDLEIFKDISIQELLMHRSGLPSWRNFYVCRRDWEKFDEERLRWMVEVLKRVRIDQSFVGRDCYSDVGMILLGLVMERINAQREDVQFELLKDDLGVSGERMGFASQLRGKAKLVPTGYCAVRGRELCGEVWDENSAALGGVAGHAGLFASGDSLVVMIDRLLRSRLGRKMIEVSRPYIADGNPSLVGFRQGNDQSSEVFGAGRAMGHMGFTGCAFWVCLESRRLAVFLSNRVLSGRVNPGFRLVRRRVFGLLDDFGR